MHFSHTLPRPIARLARILAALERLRVGGTPYAFDQRNAFIRSDEWREDFQADCTYNMESLSLSQCGSPIERRCDDLGFLSLSLIEETDPGRRDGLSDLSLTRNFPPRPGP
jgi:hypothetical protein